MIKVLHILSGIGYQGGVQSLLLNYYKRIDTNSIHFDFLVQNDKMCGFEKNFLDRGANIFYVPPKRKGLIKCYKGLKKVIKNGNYDIVHIHQDFLSYLALIAAKKVGVKVRIVHSHKANQKESFIKKIKRLILTKLCIKYSTNLFACGNDAARWTFGIDLFTAGKVYVLNNAINSKKYIFNNCTRMVYRNKLNLKENNIVIGNVARFTYQKNHSFLIDVFGKIIEKNNNYRLILVGDGELRENVLKKIRDLKLEDYILYLGERNDVDCLMQAMDKFILTSRFEGLPVTMVEAQASNLQCIVSNSITHEIDLNNNNIYIDLRESADVWASKIISLKPIERKDCSSQIEKCGFDICLETKKLEKKYFELVEKEVE